MNKIGIIFFVIFIIGIIALFTVLAVATKTDKLLYWCVDDMHITSSGYCVEVVEYRFNVIDLQYTNECRFVYVSLDTYNSLHIGDIVTLLDNAIILDS